MGIGQEVNRAKSRRKGTEVSSSGGGGHRGHESGVSSQGWNCGGGTQWSLLSFLITSTSEVVLFPENESHNPQNNIKHLEPS